MDSEDSARRQHARLTFSQPVSGNVTASHNVSILDLSLGGARLEHTAILRPGSICYLRLPVEQQALSVMCRVIWSRAVGRAEGRPGETGLLYQSGVQFSNMAREVQIALAAFLKTRGR